jgi:ribosome maturation factor RimP
LFAVNFPSALREEVVSIPPGLQQEIELCVSRHGAVLVDLVARGGWKNRVFEVFVDNEEGVSLDLCTRLSREIQPVLDRGMEGGSYKLIVSSPGLDRPLQYPWQFRKHVGKTLQVIVPATEGGTVVKGKLLSVSESGIVLECDPGREERAIEFSEIVVARVKTPW